MRQQMYFLLIFMLLAWKGANTQGLVRIYEDNDFLNMRGLGTDEAYTNGTRIDVFFLKKHPSRWWLDKLLPKAGPGSENVYGWGAMQLMFTPRDISQEAYQPDDYSYAGALLASHTLYSYHPQKKYSIQTEILGGVIGPAAMAKQVQIGVHRLIHYQRPMGWSHQFKNDLLLNVNMTLEKELATWGPAVEVIGGVQVFGGTMLNGGAIYPEIRIGKMGGYFQGFLQQYSSPGSTGRNRKIRQWQAYFIIKPEAEFVATNALVEGGMFTHHPDAGGKGSGSTAGTGDFARGVSASHPGLRKCVGSMNYGAVVSSGNFGISFIQSSSTAVMKGSYSHEVGNISLYFAW